MTISGLVDGIVLSRHASPDTATTARRNAPLAWRVQLAQARFENSRYDQACMHGTALLFASTRKSQAPVVPCKHCFS